MFLLLMYPHVPAPLQTSYLAYSHIEENTPSSTDSISSTIEETNDCLAAPAPINLASPQGIDSLN
jgi:hypothetical protein